MEFTPCGAGHLQTMSHGLMIVTTYGIDSSFTEAETISVTGNVLVAGKLGTYVRLDSEAGRAVLSGLGLPPMKSFR